MDPFTVLVSVVLVVVVLLVHEAGHYYTGALAGIPASDRRLVLAALPPHVALADDDGWVSPFENDRFSTAYGRHDPTRSYGQLYTAAGFLAQVGVVVPLGAAMAVGGQDIGVGLVGTSLGFVLVYLVIDLIATAYRGRAFGDTTQLWRLDPITTVGTLAFVIATHAGVLVVLG